MWTQSKSKQHGRRAFPYLVMRLLSVAVLSLPASVVVAAGPPCMPLVLQGAVKRGQAFTHPMSRSLDFKLEAVPAGWIVRVLPHALPRPQHDYAELANPPYLSPTPLLISTDFSFRAQDAVAWNPRNFRYFTNATQWKVADAAYQRIQTDPMHRAGSGPLLALLPEAKDATLTILDTEITGGTADQTGAAATVASHLAQTAHRVRTDLSPSPLGEILSISFRVAFPPEGCTQAR